MSSGITTDVKVSLILKEFLLCTNRSDTIILNRHDDLIKTITPLLKTSPDDWKPIKDRTFYIKIMLPYNRDINIRYRNYLDDVAQNYVAIRLNKIFKAVFHNYVLAFVSAGGEQIEGISDFCKMYKIKCDHINIEMLKKSWDRSNEKQIWKTSTTSCPLIF